MCTALTLKTADSYFGRTLDLDCSYNEELVILPRRFPFEFRRTDVLLSEHYAIIGMAAVVSGIPLFYDGANEHGLAMAGLNFPCSAHYFPERAGKDNIAPFEFIPWILGKCRDLNEAKILLGRLNLADIAFSEDLPASPLHWIIADKSGAVTVESTEGGLRIYENPVGTLTNEPPFDIQLFNLNNFRGLRTLNGESEFSKSLGLSDYCQGLGALGLPGDVSSMSRFVRAVFGRESSVCAFDESSSVGQLFHLLSSVSMNRGICKSASGNFDATLYTSCINTDRGLYYYTAYDNQRICCVDMHKADLSGRDILRFPLIKEQQIYYQN